MLQKRYTTSILSAVWLVALAVGLRTRKTAIRVVTRAVTAVGLQEAATEAEAVTSVTFELPIDPTETEAFLLGNPFCVTIR